jgi:hypothetical protein
MELLAIADGASMLAFDQVQHAGEPGDLSFGRVEFVALRTACGQQAADVLGDDQRRPERGDGIEHPCP